MPQLIIDLTDAQYSTLTALHGQEIDLMVNLRNALLNSSDLDLLRVDKANHTLTANTIATDGSLAAEQLLGIWPGDAETIPMSDAQYTAANKLRNQGVDLHFATQSRADGVVRAIAVRDDDKEITYYDIQPDGSVSAQEYDSHGNGWNDVAVQL